MRWSTAAAEGFVKRALSPLVGLGLVVYEALRDGDPRALILTAAAGLVFGQPVARIFDQKLSRPAGSTSPPPSPTAPTDDPS